MIRVLRTRLRQQDGMTLPELMVSMMILGFVMSAVYGVLWSVQRSYGDEVNRSTNNTQMNLAFQKLDKEIQSAQAMTVYKVTNSGATWTKASPATGTAGNGLLIYTQAYANTRELASPGPASGFSCVQWRIVTGSDGNPQMQSRRWAVDYLSNQASLVTGWSVIATARQMPNTVDGTLQAAATAAATTISVTEPTPGGSLPFPISVGTGATQEQMLVTGVTGSGPYTYTVTRGYNGTTAQAHVAAVAVTQGNYFLLAFDTSYAGRLIQTTLTMNSNVKPTWPATSGHTQNLVATRTLTGWNIQFATPNVCESSIPS